MTEREFKDRFVASFLAAWCAENYASACSRGEQHLLSNPPVEDAVYLASEAWDRYTELVGDN